MYFSWGLSFYVYFYISLCMFKPAVNQTMILFHSSSTLYKLPSSASLAHSRSCLLRRFFASLCTYFSVSWSVCFCHPTCSLYICLCFILVPRVLLCSMPAKQIGLADSVTHCISLWHGTASRTCLALLLGDFASSLHPTIIALVGTGFLWFSSMLGNHCDFL